MPFVNRGASRQRIASNTVRLFCPDCDDNQIWLQSTNGETRRMQRREREDFWFTESDLLVITNTGGERATLRMDCLEDATVGLVVGSNRTGSFRLRAGEHKIMRLKAGEVLTVRDVHMSVRETGMTVRPGQSVVI